MLLLLFFITLTIMGFVLCYLDNKYWDTDGVTIIGGVAGILGAIGTCFSVIALVITLCAAPANQAAWELKYEKLNAKIAHIDSYNKEEIITEIDEWNTKWRENTYAPSSPWMGWYYTIDTSTTDLIKID